MVNKQTCLYRIQILKLVLMGNKVETVFSGRKRLYFDV